jgi:cell division septation protein DedD
MSDEGVHEIQLNGKQLVFLFMAATVVAVVIFLCGVMVGRGVPVRAGSGDAPEQAELDPTAVLRGSPAAQAVTSMDNAPVTAQETLTYPSLLEDPNPPAETLKPPVEPSGEAPAPVAPPPVAVGPPPAAIVPPRPVVAPSPAVVAPPAPARSLTAAPQPASPAPAAGRLPAPREASAPASADKPADRGRVSGQVADVAWAEPAGNGFVVQVAAVRQRAEANTIARRLSTRGYPAFVTTAGANFRVRVGKYTDRREAESIAGRLERDEQFKPWITR